MSVNHLQKEQNWIDSSTGIVPSKPSSHWLESGAVAELEFHQLVDEKSANKTQ